MYRKEKAEKAFLTFWPNKDRLLPLPKPCKYSGNARRYRIRKRKREQDRRYAPLRLSDAVVTPLIAYHEPPKGDWIEDDWFYPTGTDIDLWIKWLRDVRRAASFAAAGYYRPKHRLEDIFAPILKLEQTLEDLKLGARSEYTASFFIARTRGRPKDSEVILRYKSAVGTAYRVLCGVGFCSQKRAVRRLKATLTRLGFRHQVLGQLTELARKSSQREYEMLSENFATTLLSCLSREVEFFCKYHELLFEFIDRPSFGEFEAAWDWLVRRFFTELMELPPNHKGFERRKILRAWVHLHDLIICIALHLYGHKDDLKRFPLYRRRK